MKHSKGWYRGIFTREELSFFGGCGRPDLAQELWWWLNGSESDHELGEQLEALAVV